MKLCISLSLHYSQNLASCCILKHTDELSKNTALLCIIDNRVKRKGKKPTELGWF